MSEEISLIQDQVHKFSLFLIKNQKNVLLFSNSALKQFWQKQYLKQTGFVLPTQFVTLEDMQKQLCYSIANKKNEQLRLLTFAERKLVLAEFLSDKNIQQKIMNLEGVTAKSPIDTNFEVTYAPKIQKMFNHYPLFYAQNISNQKNTNNKHYNIVKSLLEEYTLFLYQKKFIDYASASYTLFEDKNACGNEVSLSITVAFPKLFLTPQILWLEQFQTIMSNVIIKEQEVSFFKKNKEQTPILYKNVAQELSFTSQKIASLLKKGEKPQDIAISICEIDSFIESDINSLSYRYDIPFIYNKQARGGILYQVLKALESCVESNMHPHALQDFLLHPIIPWKDRAMHLKIVQLGLKNNCIDNASLRMWTSVLSHEKYKIENKYFFSLVKDFKSLIKANSFLKLQECFETFIKNYIAPSFAWHIDNSKNKKADGIIIRKIKEIIKELLVYEKNNSINEQKKNKHMPNVWSCLCAVAAERADALTHIRTDGVAVYDFPQSAGMWYKHHFFINLTQKSLASIGNIGTFFDKQTDEFLFAQLLEDKETDVTQFCKKCIECGGEHVYLSASLESYQKIQLPAVEWSFTEDIQAHQGFENIECNFWKKDGLAQIEEYQSCLFSNMLEGLAFQQTNKKQGQKSVFSFPLQTNTQKLLKQSFLDSTIKASSIASLLLTPLHFTLENILNIQPLFDNLDTQLAGSMFLGSFLHACLENEYKTEDEKQSTESLFKSLKKHFILDEALFSYFTARVIKDYVQQVKLFLQTTMQTNTQPEIKTELIIKKTLNEIFTDTLPPVLLSGRSDLILENKRDGELFVVDYKLSNSEWFSVFRALSQTWVYFKALTTDKSFIKEDVCSQYPVRGAVFVLKDNFFTFINERDTKDFAFLKEKKAKKHDSQHSSEILEISKCFEKFLYESINIITSADFGKEFSDELLQIQQKFIGEQDLSESLQLILRDKCYIYRNR